MKTSDERCDGRRTVVTALHLVMVVWGGGFGDVISAEVLRCYVLEEAVARILTR
jgi:hypothetical protein